MKCVQERKSSEKASKSLTGQTGEGISFPTQLVKTGGGDSFFNAKTTVQDFKEHTHTHTHTHDKIKCVTAKEHNNFPVTNPKEMEINELSDKEFIIIV